MSTISQFADWINQTFYHNLRRLITGPQMNTFGHKCIENFAVKGEAIPKYSTTISQIKLDSNNSITIIHSLNTNIPQVLLIDESGLKINVTSYCKIVVDNSNSISLTFFGEIPITGNGYYTLIILKFVSSVLAPYFLVFEDNFAGNWTTVEGADENYYPAPSGWLIWPYYILDGSNYYLQKTDEGCLLHDVDGGSFQMEGYYLESDKRYRLEIETTAPVIINADQAYNVNGVAVLEIPRTGNDFSIQLDNVVEATIKFCRLYEYYK